MNKTKYTLSEQGHLTNNLTGTVYPPRKGTHLATAVIDELIAAGCAEEDYTGLVFFKPDGILLGQAGSESEQSEQKPETETKPKPRTKKAAK